MDMQKTVLSVVGNPRPASRTHAIAATLATAVAGQIGGVLAEPIDLAAYGARILDYEDHQVAAEAQRVLDADVLVVASPTYKATYSGLLKAFLDRIGGGALGGTPAVPVLLGGAPNHSLAVDVHFTPLLLELGASIPARGLFVLESELDGFEARARAWAQAAFGTAPDAG
jgi:FMN reductase